MKVDLKLLAPPASTGMKIVRLLDITASATKRNNAAVSSLLQNAAITITHTAGELRGLNRESLRLYYLDPADRKWKPVSSQFNAATLTLTASTNHFSNYGEMADPVISGPPMIMAFEANLHSGTAKASYPIELPPGPGGFKPNLRLVYDSGKADGMKNRRSLGSWVGVGWTLDPGYISYDEAGNAYYLEIGGVGYEIIKSGTDYFTKPDLFYKITRDEATQKWEIRDRSGNYYLFGSSGDAIRYYDKSGTPVYYRWDLHFITDAHNSAIISYSQNIVRNSVRSSYPSSISYGGVTVSFTTAYDEVNPYDGPVRLDDPISTPYVGAPQVMEDRKLDNIQVRWQGNLVRKYAFSYETSSRQQTGDYGGIYYSGSLMLHSITQFGADGASSLPAMTFAYLGWPMTYRDGDNTYYSGNPGNPAYFGWPRLTTINNGYGAVATFGWAQMPASTPNNAWTRRVVASKTINPGSGPNQTYTYTYDGNPEYLGHGFDAGYRGFRKVKETDAAGNYTWRYFYTTGYDATSGKDWEKLTGREYQVEEYDSAGNLLRKTVNDWGSVASEHTPGLKEYAFLSKWDGYGINDGYFNSPWGVAADSTGNAYVTDSGNNRMQKFTGTGDFVTRWGSQGTGGNQFDAPRGVAIRSDGKIYVADYNNQRINKFDSDGAYLSSFTSPHPAGVTIAGTAMVSRLFAVDPSTSLVTMYSISPDVYGNDVVTVAGAFGGWGQDDGHLNQAYGLASDSSWNVYVADSWNHRIQKFDFYGNWLATWGGPNPGSGDGQFNIPTGVAVDGSGDIYVADNGNHRIQKITPTGPTTFTFRWRLGGPAPGSDNGQFNSPRSVAIATIQGSAYVLVTDQGNNRMQRITTAGAYAAQWGAYASGDGLANPFAAPQSGNALAVVASTLAHEIRRFDSAGKYLGRFGSQGAGDGQFSYPLGAQISVQGGAMYVYVADTQNHRIQKFTSSGAWQATWGGPAAGSGTSQFNLPYDAAVDSSGSVYVADAANHRVKKIVPTGDHSFTVSWTAGRVDQNGNPLIGSGNGEFFVPTGVAVTSAGVVYVVDSGNNRIQKLDAGDGHYLGQWGSGPDNANGHFNNPGRIAVDDAWEVFVTDSGNSRIQKFSPSGDFISAFGVSGAGDGAFSYPEGIAVSGEGDFIYVADTGNNRVQKLTYVWEVRLNQTDVTTGGKTATNHYTYDNRGNVAAITRQGDLLADQDKSTMFRSYSDNQTAWILDRVQRERVYSGVLTSDPGAGFKVETRYYYDGNASHTDQPTKGDLTKTEMYDPGQTPPKTIAWQRTYDLYGNVLTETDANGRVTSYIYDANGRFVIMKTLPPLNGGTLTLVEYYAWDQTGAKITSETDVNSQTTTYEYDTFWRPLKIRRPGDEAPAIPTIEHQYNAWGLIYQQHIKTIAKIDATHSLWSKKFFDGLGRVTQVQAQGDPDHSIITTTSFDNRGLTDKQYVTQDVYAPGPSYYSPQTGWKYTAFTYDALKRVTLTTKPDGATVSQAYVDWDDTVTNERGKKKHYYNDAFGRLVKVEELDDAFAVYATTTYKYDILNNLIEVKDNALNTTTATFNGFSRKTAISDPDMGVWSYGYDDQGNLTGQTDAKGQALTFVYDEINRLKAKNQGATTLASYSYDDAAGGNYGKGRRTGMSDSSETMSYKYDSRGREVQETRTVDSTPYTTGYTYDSADRLVTVIYPTGETTTQGYNDRGQPKTLSSSANSTLVSTVLYNGPGLPIEMDLGNGTKTTYGYWNLGGTSDHQTDGTQQYGRLWELKTVKTGTPDTVLQDMAHTWDNTGNLTQRQNLKAGETETETFTYDFLDRLTSESNLQFTFGDTGDASSRVNYPSKAAVDASGNILVADTFNFRIAKYNSAGVYQSSFGSAGYGNGQFVALAGVTIDSSGNIYTTEWLGAQRVQKFDSNGNFVAAWDGSNWPSGAFNQPMDIVFNPGNGYLYVADQGNNRIVYFDTSGNYVGQWGSPGSQNGQFNIPWGVGVDGSGTVYVADTMNHRIQRFTATGTFQVAWGSYGSGPSQFSAPKDVAIDSAGNIFVADSGNNRIQKFTGNRSFVTAWGGAGSNPGQFSGPRGVALASGRIYVVDTGNSRVQTFDSATTASWAYNQIGNMTWRDSVLYIYGWPPTSPPRPHGVSWTVDMTTVAMVSYAYDADGNMTSRGAQTLTWDVENRLTAVSGGVSYVYDGNGFRVKKTENGVTTLYINKYYEKNLSTGVVTLYYYLGGKMVAYKEGSNLRYVYKDHLTGASLTADSSGTAIGGAKYSPYGQMRSSWGALPAQKFTGQRLDDVGLYYYASKSVFGGLKGNPAADPLAVSKLWAGRYYDPTLARFIQPDTIVPGAFNPQALNRYTYTLDNPQRYVDDDGHFAILGAIAFGAGLGAALNMASYTVNSINSGTFSVGGLAVAGASGAIAGTVSVVVVAFAPVGLLGGGLGGLVGTGFAGAVGGVAGTLSEAMMRGEQRSPGDLGRAAAAGFFGGVAGQASSSGFSALRGDSFAQALASVDLSASVSSVVGALAGSAVGSGSDAALAADAQAGGLQDAIDTAQESGTWSADNTGSEELSGSSSYSAGGEDYGDTGGIGPSGDDGDSGDW